MTEEWASADQGLAASGQLLHLLHQLLEGLCLWAATIHGEALAGVTCSTLGKSLGHIADVHRLELCVSTSHQRQEGQWEVDKPVKECVALAKNDTGPDNSGVWETFPDDTLTPTLGLLVFACRIVTRSQGRHVHQVGDAVCTACICDILRTLVLHLEEARGRGLVEDADQINHCTSSSDRIIHRLNVSDVPIDVFDVPLESGDRSGRAANNSYFFKATSHLLEELATDEAIATENSQH